MEYVPSNSIGVSLKIEKTFSHPNYDGTSAYFDVGVIKTKMLTFNADILPVCLPERAQPDFDFYKGRAAQLLGKLTLQHYKKSLPIYISSNKR